MFYCNRLTSIAFLLSISMCAFGSLPAEAAAHPNIVLIISDCLRTDHVDASGAAGLLMPNVLNAAANGAWFHNAVAPSSWTSTATSSFLTSMDVDTHQVYLNSDLLDNSYETMAEYLKAQGYSTACVQMNANLSPSLGYGQGFDTYDFSVGNLAEDATATALARIAAMPEPFFIYIHYVATHVPFRSPVSYRTAQGYPPAGLSASEQDIIENHMFEYYTDHLSYQLGFIPVPTYTPLSATGMEAIRLLYKTAAKYTDDQVAQVMAAVNGRSPDPYLFFIADHGEHFWEHNYIGHSMTLYEEVERVPLIITGPGIAPQVNEANVTTLDLLPTLASMLGFPVRPEWQGQDLFAPRDPDGPTFAYTQGQLSPYFVYYEMARWGDWKLILDRHNNIPMLFDLASDPQENDDLSGSNTAMLEQMRIMLDARRLTDARMRPAAGWVTSVPFNFPVLDSTVTLMAPQGSEYKWLKDGVYLAEDWPHVQDVEARQLVIEGASAADLGRYECVYRDDAKRLHITRAYDLALLPANGVPATAPWGLALLFLFVTSMGLAMLTRKPAAK